MYVLREVNNNNDSKWLIDGLVRPKRIIVNYPTGKRGINITRDFFNSRFDETVKQHSFDERLSDSLEIQME